MHRKIICVCGHSVSHHQYDLASPDQKRDLGYQQLAEDINAEQHGRYADGFSSLMTVTSFY